MLNWLRGIAHLNLLMPDNVVNLPGLRVLDFKETDTDFQH